MDVATSSLADGGAIVRVGILWEEQSLFRKYANVDLDEEDSKLGLSEPACTDSYLNTNVSNSIRHLCHQLRAIRMLLWTDSEYLRACSVSYEITRLESRLRRHHLFALRFLKYILKDQLDE